MILSRYSISTGAALVSTALVFAAAKRVEAQDMNVSLSRLRAQNETLTNDVNGDGTYDPEEGDTFDDANGNGFFDQCTSGAGDGRFCADNASWARLMTQLAGSMIPPVLTPAGTRGVRGFYLGFESWITGIDDEEEYWHRGVEGDGGSVSTARSRFVDPVLAWGRFNLRKGLPFGFDLGASIGYLANTSYWTLGLEVRWALFEGFREDIGWIPDLAVRGAVQTLLGDGEFNVTVPTIDLILSEPFVVADTVELSPYIVGQVAFVFADSELVDLTPQESAFSGCEPSPTLPESGTPPYCTGDGSDLNNNAVFESIRSTRWRLGAGLAIRYEWIVFTGAFVFDVVRPQEADGNLPGGLPRQWQVDLGLGVSL